MESSGWPRIVADPLKPAQGVHFEASVATGKSPVLKSPVLPTAMQKCRLGQETPLSGESDLPVLGVDSSCQLAPSKRSAIARKPDGSTPNASPTAWHARRPGQLTPPSSEFTRPCGGGV